MRKFITRFVKPKPLRNFAKIDEEMSKELKPELPKELTTDLQANLKLIRQILGENSADVIIREFKIGADRKLSAALVAIDGLVSRDTVDREILQPLMLLSRISDPDETLTNQTLIEILKKYTIPIGEIKEQTDLKETLNSVLSGETALFVDGAPGVIILNTRGWEHRTVGIPNVETVIRGPFEAFVETLRVNTALMRRRIKDPNLRVEQMRIGRRSKTDVAVLYIEGLVNPELVKEVKNRLRKIDIDYVTSGMVEELIEDNTYSLFPQIQATERPDRAAEAIMQGRVLIIIDGTPFNLIVPAVLENFYHTPEDENVRWWGASFMRILRLLSALIAVSLSSLYIVMVSFQPQMIPADLALSLAASREGIPFPAVVEVLLMEVSMEIIKEATIRLPSPIAATIGIVGGLVLGQAAVAAKLISSLMVIIVAITAITSFVAPSYEMAMPWRILKFVLIFLSNAMGLFGLMIGLTAILIHMIVTTSFNVPYMAPYGPSQPSAILKNSLFRAPLQFLQKRPRHFRPLDEIRQQSDQGSKEWEGEKRE